MDGWLAQTSAVQGMLCNLVSGGMSFGGAEARALWSSEDRDREQFATFTIACDLMSDQKGVQPNVGGTEPVNFPGGLRIIDHMSAPRATKQGRKETDNIRDGSPGPAET